MPPAQLPPGHLRPDRLTDADIAAALPRERAYKTGDGHGLFVLVFPDGSRRWRWNHYRPANGKRNTMSFGTFPAVTVAQARKRRDAARALLLDGVDPGEVRKDDRKAAAAAKAAALEVTVAPFAVDSHGTLTVRLSGRYFKLSGEDAGALRLFLNAAFQAGTTS